MAHNRKSVIIPLLGLGGVLLLIGIFYQSGFRVTTAPEGAIQEQTVKREPGVRRQPVVGDTEPQPGREGMRAGKRPGGNRQAKLRSGAAGTQQIVVITETEEKGFTGQDLQSLEQTTVASSRGLRAGWRVIDVMNACANAGIKGITFTATDD